MCLSVAISTTIVYDADFAVPFELPVTAEDALEDKDVTRTDNVQIEKKNVKMKNNGVEDSVLDACLNYKSNESEADSDYAFAPSYNFLLDENGIEDSVS